MVESWPYLAHGVFAVIAAPGLAHGARIVDLVAVPAAGALALPSMLVTVVGEEESRVCWTYASPVVWPD